MSYSLARGISCCRVGDRFIFLDAVRDRYFCLGTDAQAAFARLLEDGGQPARDSAVVAKLVERGILVASEHAAPPRLCYAPSPRESLLERELETRPAAVAFALTDLALATVRLKLVGLPRLLRRLSAAKAALMDPCRVAPDVAIQVAAAFRQAALLASSPNQCLRRSIAVASSLLRQGASPDLVFGVRLGPFQAHCWVQHDSAIVNDRMDLVRTFTPILVI
jgi:hypothetical protein